MQRNFHHQGKYFYPNISSLSKGNDALFFQTFETDKNKDNPEDVYNKMGHLPYDQVGVSVFTLKGLNASQTYKKSFAEEISNLIFKTFEKSLGPSGDINWFSVFVFCNPVRTLYKEPSYMCEEDPPKNTLFLKIYFSFHKKENTISKLLFHSIFNEIQRKYKFQGNLYVYFFPNINREDLYPDGENIIFQKTHSFWNEYTSFISYLDNSKTPSRFDYQQYMADIPGYAFYNEVYINLLTLTGIYKTDFIASLYKKDAAQTEDHFKNFYSWVQYDPVTIAKNFVGSNKFSPAIDYRNINIFEQIEGKDYLNNLIKGELPDYTKPILDKIAPLEAARDNVYCGLDKLRVFTLLDIEPDRTDFRQSFLANEAYQEILEELSRENFLEIQNFESLKENVSNFEPSLAVSPNGGEAEVMKRLYIWQISLLNPEDFQNLTSPESPNTKIIYKIADRIVRKVPKVFEIFWKHYVLSTEMEDLS